MALIGFTVARTFYNVRVVIHVRPVEKEADVLVMRDQRILRMEDEKNATFRGLSDKEWSDPLRWDRICGKIAEAVHLRPN